MFDDITKFGVKLTNLKNREVSEGILRLREFGLQCIEIDSYEGGEPYVVESEGFLYMLVEGGFEYKSVFYAVVDSDGDVLLKDEDAPISDLEMHGCEDIYRVDLGRLGTEKGE